MSGIPPNIAQLIQMMQQAGMTPQGGPTQGMMGAGAPGQMMPGQGGPQGDPMAMAHARYHQMRLQNPNMPGWGQLSPQQQAQYTQQGPATMPQGATGGGPTNMFGNPGANQPTSMGPAAQLPQGAMAAPAGGLAMGATGAAMPSMGGPAGAPRMPTPPIKSFKKGGMVEKTGVYRLHKGEKVIPAGKTAPARHRPSDKKVTVRHASAKAPPAKTAPVKHASARHAPPSKKRK